MDPPLMCDGICQKMRQRLWDCQQRKQFCDIILETQERDQIWAHKVIVASGSLIIYNMLMDTNLHAKDEQSGIQVLRIPGVSLASLLDMVRFTYLGNIEHLHTEIELCWDRFEICDPIRLYGESVNPKGSKPQSYPASCPEIKKESESLQSEGSMIDKEETRESPVMKRTEVLKLEPSVKQGRRKRKCSSPKQRATKLRVSYKEDSSSEDELTVSEYINTRITLRPRDNNTFTEEPEDESLTEVDDEHDPEFEVQKPKLLTPKKTPGRKKTLSTTSKKKTGPAPKMEKNTVVAPPSSALLCKTCNIQFDQKDLYREHREKMHKGDRHTCVECGKTFNRGNRLKAHRIENHFKEGLPEPTWHHCQAEGCTYKSVYKDGLDLHYKSVHSKEKVICETCGAGFSQRYTLTLHKRKVHGIEGPTFPCDKCDQFFFMPCELKNHKIRVHDKNMTHLCDQCPFMAYTQYAVDVHMFSKHGVPLKSNKTIYTCPHCNYKHHAKNIMTAHIERHGEKDFKCNQCTSVFRCNRDLNAHYRLKHSNKPKTIHHCPYEGCKFSSIYGRVPLKNHISRMHENKDYKPWACEICNYRTNVKGNLHLHLRKVHRLHPHIKQHRVPKIPVSEGAPTMETPSVVVADTLTAADPVSVPQITNHQPVLPAHSAALITTTPSPTPVQQNFQSMPVQNYTEIVPKTDPAPSPTQAQQNFPSIPQQNYVGIVLKSDSGLTQESPTYHTMSRVETVPHTIPQPETVSHSVSQPETVAHTMSRAETVSRLPPGAPPPPGGQYNLVIPPYGYNEGLFMQGLQ